MPKPIKLKTAQSDKSLASYLKTLNKTERAQAEQLFSIFRDATGVTGKLWGSNVVGFGSYQYTRSNGDYADFLATGFAIRKSGPTLYIMPGYTDYSNLLKILGPHKLGKSCLYLKNLDDIHVPTLKKLIKQGLRDLKRDHVVTMQ